MLRRPSIKVLALSLLFVSRFAAVRGAPPESLEAWLPDDVIGYVKVSDLGAHLDAFLASDLRRELEATPLGQHALAQEPWREFRRGMDEFRTATGKDALDVFKCLAGKEVIIGARIGYSGPEVIALARTRGEKELDEALSSLRKAVEFKAGQAIQGFPTIHGDRTIETYDRLSLTKIDGILALANSTAALGTVIDLSSGKASGSGNAAGSVQASAGFRKAAATLPSGAMATLVMKPQLLPNFDVPEKAQDALASLLFGGWMGALRSSEWMTAALSVRDGGIALDISSILSAAGQAGETWKKFQGFFPQASDDGLLGRLERRGIVGAVALHRNLRSWWENREALIRPEATYGLSQFAQILGMAFGGRDFATEILPQLGNRLVIVSRSQEYGGTPDKPKPSIPGFAAILDVGGAKEAQDRMVAAFQTIVGFVNMDRAQKGQEPAVLKVERVGDVDLQVLRLSEKEGPAVTQNFSPSLAVVGSKLVLSSSAELGKVLVEDLGGSGATAGPATPGSATDALFIDARALASILADNREFIIADNMAKKGQSREQAEGEIRVLFDILKLVRDLRVTSSMAGDAVKVKVELRGKAGASGSSSPLIPSGRV